MGLTEKQRQIARDAYLSTLSGGEFLDVYAAVEAVMKEQDEQLKKAENGWGRALDKLNDCLTKRGDLIDKNHRLREQASAAEQGQGTWKDRCDQSEREYFARQQPAQPTHEHCMRLVDPGSDERLCSAPGCHYRTGSVSSCICYNGGDSWMRCPDHKPAQSPEECAHVHPLKQRTKDGELEYICADCGTSIEHKPPAGDVQMVELIRRALDNTVEKLNDLADDVSNSRSFSRSYYACEQIEEARKQIEARICNHDIRLPHECKDCFDIFSDELRRQESIGLPSNRLAKPAEQTPVQVVAGILKTRTVGWKPWVPEQIAAEIVAALSDGRGQQ